MSERAPLTGNLAVLRQGLALLDELSDDLYTAAGEGRSTVGAQYRHILDHYRSFVTGLGCGLVDYDARERDPLIETSRDEARRRTEELHEVIRRLSPADLGRPLRVHLAATADESEAAAHGSTVGRELLFLLSHTVHHYAIIRLLVEDLGGACAPEFGVAPSTLAHRAATG
jgi:uncharacterized damage-inducible protein DinB